MAPPNTFLLTSITILPFTTSKYSTPTDAQPCYIFVQDGLIADLGPGPVPASVLSSIPKDTPIIDKAGHTLIPGLIDAHVHCNDGNAEESLVQSLRFGVTTVGDMHNEGFNLLKMKQLASDLENQGVYADIKYAGIGATIDDGWPIPVVTAHDKSEHTANMIKAWPHLVHPSEAAPYVDAQVSIGASYIKLFHEIGDALLPGPFPVPTIELQSALVAAAHSHNLLALAHALSYAGTIAILEAGVDGLTHCFYDREPTDELVQLYLRNKAHLNPTLAALGSLTAEGGDLQQAFAADPLAQRLLVSEDANHRLISMMSMGKGRGQVKNAYATVSKLHKAGVQIVVGSDSATPAVGTAYGLSAHHELRLLVRECGLSGYEALWSATAGTAERFGWKDRGVLAVGKRADLLLVAGDPVAFLEGREGESGQYCLPISGVWRGGVVVKVWEEVMQ